jgi:hypothetical protein
MNDADAEALLAAVLCGEVDPGDPRVVALLREQPWREAELAAARSAQDAVRSASDLRRAVLAAARRMPTSPGEERLAGLMAQHVAGVQRPADQPEPGQRGRRSRSRRFVAIVLTLAAVVLLAIMFWPRTDRVSNTPPEYLGHVEVAPLAPIGDVHAGVWPAFRWQGKADSYRVVVYPAGSPREPGDEICSSPAGIVANEWQPDAQASAKLATHVRIEWELRFEDPNGGGVRLAAAALSR